MGSISKSFFLRKIQKAKHKVICFALDSARPETYIDQLETELRKQKILGPVLLDLLTSNGATSRRFFEVEFDGSKLSWLSAKVVSPVTLNQEILALCRKFYEERPNVLRSNSVLSKAAVYKELSAKRLIN